MNHIYKVIWNKAKHCYTVVSEVAKSHMNGSVGGKSGSVAVILAAGALIGFSPLVSDAANITDTKTSPKMIGYEQIWDTNVRLGVEKLSTSIKAYQYQGNSLQLNKLEFISGKTKDGQNQLTIRMGAYVDGVNKEANIFFADSNTTNRELSTTIDNKTGIITSSLKDSDDKTLTSTVDISTYVKDKITDVAAVVYDKNKTSLKSTNSNGVGENAIALGKGASAVTNSIAIGNGAYTQDGTFTKGQSVALGNGAVTGAKSTSIGANAIGGREGTITIGTNANNGALYATIVGTDSSINYKSRNSGAASTVIGAKNTIKNDDKTYSGVANGILGASNTIENSNGVTIQGSGNTVTDAYKDMKLNFMDSLKLSNGDYSFLAEKESGAVAVIGGGNTISNQTSSTVIGFGNILKGQSSNGVFMAGSHNTLTNVSNSLVMGDKNTLTNRKNVISLGNANTVEADNAVAIGNGATVKEDGGVAIGVSSVADRVAGTEKGALGTFAPDAISTTEKSTWISTAGAVSVGDTVRNITRQITNVAAGSEDTDAVNVAQLKQVAFKADNASKGWKLTTSHGNATTVKPEDTVDFSPEDTNLTVTNDGANVKLGLNQNLHLTSATFGTTLINNNGLKIGSGTTGLEFSTSRVSVGGQQIHDVADGTDDADAVNLGQLKKAISEGNTDSHIKAGEYNVGADNKVSMDVVDKNDKKVGTVTITDVAKASDVGDVSKIASDIKNKEGNTTVVDAVNNVNNKVGDLNYSQVKAGEIEDGDNTTTAIGKLNQKLSDVEKTAGAHSTVSTDESGNISVTPTTNKETGSTDYKVSLNKDLNLDSVTTGETVMNKAGVKVGDNVSLTKDGLSVGDTKVTGNGFSIGDKTYISKDGLNANNYKVTNVAEGTISAESKDAVNGSQLFATNQQVTQNAQSINKLGNRINKVGAGAAALAALHPLDFDPDDKWDFAAGYGNYNGENAAAIGAYYRPNEDTMFSVGGSFGNGENMVNAGISLKLGQGNHVSTSKVAMAKEIKDLRKELETLKSAMLDVNAGKKLDTSKLQLFPDVPQNHWAYEYVSQLKGNGILAGYPDGEFKGDRPMTRYEFAAMLYKAMLEGATLSDQILTEFAPELERFTVDTVHADKDGKPVVERVRTVKR